MTTTNRNRRFAWLAALALAMPGTLQAQGEPPAADTLPRYRLEGVTVTVTRAEVRRDAVPQKIDVITAADIARTPAEELTDLLKKQAAVDVIQYPGLLSGIGMRGFRPQFFGIHQRTLVLVDGRPAGITNLALLPMHDIARIEVLRGPASALYGSNAMGGVVNVITHRARGPLRANLSAGYGSWDTRELRAGAGGNLTSRLDFDLGLSLFERGADYRIGGGNLFRDRLSEGTVTRVGAEGPAAAVADPGDGELRTFTQYGTRSGSLRAGYQLDESWRVDVRGDRFAADRVQNPGDILALWDDRTLKDVARSSGEAALSGALGNHTLTLRAFASGEDAQNFNQPEVTEEQPQFISLRSLARWQGAQLQDVMRLGAHTLTAGFDYTAARAESERFTAPERRAAPWQPDSEVRSRAGFAEGRFTFLDERLVATLGGRLDAISFEVFETQHLPTQLPDRESHTVFNPSFGLQYRTAAGFHLRASGGRAFVTPEAFYVAGRAEQRPAADVAAINLTLGNPGLRPENSVTWDAGLGFLRPLLGVDADLTYFRTDVRDRITVQRTTPAGVELTPVGDTIRSVTTYVNADEARIRGLEARLGYDFGARAGSPYLLRLFANATRILAAEETTGGLTREIQNVADLTVNYGLEWDDLRRFGARLTGRYVGERQDTDWTDWMNPARISYPPFMVLDLAADVRLTPRYRVGFEVSNLTDEHYYEVRGYPLPGRALRLGVSAAF